VIVTGGEDHRVNVWALGRTEAIMVLSFSFPCFQRICPFVCAQFCACILHHVILSYMDDLRKHLCTCVCMYLCLPSEGPW
jgi:hypothetical protein